MNDIQKKLLELIKKDSKILGENLHKISRILSEETGITVYAQQVKHHLYQLRKKGLIYDDIKEGKTKISESESFKDSINLFNIPIFGSANCGEALALTDQRIEGFLKLSSKILGTPSAKGFIVVKAIGNSLNRAFDLPGGPIEEGDYVVVNTLNRKPKDGQYVLSIIDSAANLKRFYRNKSDGTVRLVSESTVNVPPIIIHEDDFDDYMVNGVVVKVIKKLINKKIMPEEKKKDDNYSCPNCETEKPAFREECPECRYEDKKVNSNNIQKK